VREPYSVVGYLAACTPLGKVLKLVHPKVAQAKDDGENVPEDLEWSAWDICDGNGLVLIEANCICLSRYTWLLHNYRFTIIYCTILCLKK
jgi:hypothetical protein